MGKAFLVRKKEKTGDVNIVADHFSDTVSMQILSFLRFYQSCIINSPILLPGITNCIVVTNFTFRSLVISE